MDIKSKNIKYSYGTKVVAFFTALALVLCSGVLLASSVDMMMQYSSKSFVNIFTKSTFNYTDCLAFDGELTNNLNSLKGMIIESDYKDYVSGRYCTLDEEISLASEYYDSKIQVFKDDLEANGGYSYQVTFSYSVKIASNVSCQFTPVTSKAEFLRSVETLYVEAIEKAQKACENAKVSSKNEVNAFVNLKYVVRNTESGEVFTNTTEEELASCKDGWYVTCTAKNGIIDSSEHESNKYYSRIYGPNSVLNTYFGSDGYDITICLPASDKLVEGDRYYTLSKECAGVTNNTSQYMVAVAVMLAVAFALSIYLVMVSGRTNNSTQPQISWVDKIPTDIHFCVTWGMVCLAVTAAFGMTSYVMNTMYSGSYEKNLSYEMILVNSLLFAFTWAAIVEWAMHISRYYKTHRPYIRKSVFGIVFIAFIRFCKEILSAIKHVSGFAPRKMKKKSFYVVIVYIVANMICAFIMTSAASNNGESFMASLMFTAFVNIVMLVLIWKYILALDEIVVASEKGKNGDSPEKIDSEKFPEPLKSLADNLYITQDEMKKAVDEAVKGERMKTELITNVSHDLKTPLTSIISYVDLLKKCDIDDIQAQKYISVLDDKSIRLKRLIEDLVEASKVSSGAVSINKMNVNLDELTVQAIAEVEDSFTEKNLEIIYNKGEDLPIVFADSQKTWRVIDNLFSNARKYSLEGSRIYVRVYSENGCGYFSVKNISKNALNINSEELMQRFVRGDAARTNSEGSGLGLSIAKDLCELQGGMLSLDIDGDLFKATIKLPLAASEASEVQPTVTEGE